MTRRTQTALLVWLAVTTLQGCGSGRETARFPVVYDFVASLPAATATFSGRAPRSLPAGAVSPGDSAAATGLLEIPIGARLDYFLRIPPAAILTIDRIMPGEGNAPGETATLTIVIGRDGEADETLAEIRGAAGRQVIPVPARDRPIVRISLQVGPGASPAARAGALLVERPVIRAVVRDHDRPGAGASPTAGNRPGPNVIVYLSDALRADHLGCYGYRKPTSPNIDAFASQALRFENAISQSPFTSTAVASLFTGMFPAGHGLLGHGIALPLDLRTLAELLQQAGFDTAGFITNPGAGSAFGLDRGFTFFELLPALPATVNVHALSDRMNRSIFGWLEARGNDPRPFFLYAHSTDMHTPYTPPPEIARRFARPGADLLLGTARGLKTVVGVPGTPSVAAIEDLMALYDGEIAFNDQTFGALLTELRRRGLYDDSLIIFLSDHGEEFQEHGGWQHADALYAESLQIPLIIKLPGGAGPAGAVSPILAQQVDVLPTILSALGVGIPPQVEGRDLIAAAGRDPGETSPRRGFSSFRRPDRRGVSVVEEGWKLIRVVADDGRETVELFNRVADPMERQEISGLHPTMVGYLKSVLALYESGPPPDVGQTEIDDDLRRQLEALGYVD